MSIQKDEGFHRKMTAMTISRTHQCCLEMITLNTHDSQSSAAEFSEGWDCLCSDGISVFEVIYYRLSKQIHAMGVGGICS